MRRNDTRHFGIAAGFLLLSGWGFGLDTDVFLQGSQKSALLSINITGVDLSVVEADLRAGYLSGIEYILRIYRETDGVAGILGDEMLFEKHHVRTGRWDPFSLSYELRIDTGTVEYYPDLKSFLDAYFTLKEYPLPPLSENSLYALVKVSFRRRILSPPLNLFTAFYDKYTSTSRWKRQEFPQ